MGLRAKLFSAFFTIIVTLLVFTLYYSNIKTKAFETQRITQQLLAVQARFLNHFETEGLHNLKLVKTITSDQKYRSFLQQVRDNFFSFAEEIAMDTGADIVFMVDEDINLRGVSPPHADRPSNGQKAMDSQAALAQSILNLADITKIQEAILDTGTDHKQVVALGDELFNIVFVPLKESLSDDYALGVVNVGIRLDNDWVSRLLADETTEVDVVFYIDDRPVASDMPSKHQADVLLAAHTMKGKVGVVELGHERHIMVKGGFNNAGSRAGYVLTASLDKAMAPFMSLQWQIFIAGLAALAVGLLIILMLTNKIVYPIRRLVQGTQEVMAGNYTHHVENRSKDEVGQLATAFNHMIKGLQEKEQIRDLFGKYVHPSIVGDIMKNPNRLQMGGTRKKQTLMFSDIAGFTTISETMDPEQLVDFLNEFLGAMTKELSAHEGILDKYLGDGLMAFWGEPFTEKNHALLACRAALAMQAKLETLVAQWTLQGLPKIRMRIGIATGDVVVGNIGSEQSCDYTCIGDTVNLSSRLEGVNKFYGTQIIIDEEARNLAGNEIVVRELDTVQVKGREDGTRIFELVGLATEVTPQTHKLIVHYEDALEKYRSADMAKARDAFDDILRDTPNDCPSQVMRQQCCDNMDKSTQNWTAIRILGSK